VNTQLSSTTLHRFAAPFLVLAVVLPLVYFTFPENRALWRSISIVSAWAGCALLVASILLMIREPNVSHLFGGLENMYLWHHRSGMLAYVLLLCHPLALAAASWPESAQLAWQALSPWGASWQIWLGWIALLLLMFGLTSTFIVSLPYRRWRWMHMFLGLGVALALAHVYAVAGSGYPLLLLIILTAAALGWRLIASDLGAAASSYRVTQVTRPGSDIIEARVVPNATALTISPGQFVLSSFGEGPHYHGCGEYHPFTVSGIHKDGSLSISIKALGPCSQRLQALEPGVIVRLQGPFGTFLQDATSLPQLWVAGGIGITPFIAALRAQPRKLPTTLLYLFGNEKNAAFLDELRMLAKSDPNFELLTHTSSKGLPDFPELLGKVSQVSAREVYICGPQPMAESLIPCLLRQKIPEHLIHNEKYDFR
jgi:predicted ferric reductase